MTQMIKFAGVLTTKTPLHVTAPETWYYTDQRRFSPMKGTGKPASRVMRTPVVMPAIAEALTEDTGLDERPKMRKQVVELPFFPANSLAGRIRRKACARIFDVLIAKGESISLNTYRAMVTGASGKTADGAAHRPSFFERVRKNVFMGVFGGGPYILPRGYACGDMMPITTDMVETGKITLPDTLSVEPVFARNSYDLTGVRHFFHVDDTVRHVDTALGELVENYEEDVYEWLELNFPNKEEKKKKKDSDEKKMTVSNMGIFEFVPQGVPFNVSITPYDHLNDAQVCLLLYAILDIANEQKLGGLVRHEFGQFQLQLEAMVNGKWISAIEYDEELDSYMISEDLQYLEDAFAAEIDNISAAEFEELFAVA